jgi:uncharacterized protein involved in exopolysaccharide biosynthesis
VSDDIVRNIRYYIEVFLARPLFGIIPAAAALLVGTVIVFSLPRTYYAEALVIVDSHKMPSSLVTATVANERLQFVEQRVLAREKLLSLIDKFNLFPELRATLPNTKLAEVVRNHITIQTLATEPSEHYANSSALRIGFKYSTPKLAAEVATELVAMIMDENRRTRVSRASETTQFLVREVEEFTRQLEAREAHWQKYFQDNTDALPARIPSLLIELQEKERELSALDQTIPELDEELRLLEAQLRLGADQSNEVARQRTQLAELEAELARKSLIYSDIHPEVRSLVQNIRTLKDQTAKAPASTTTALPTGTELRALSPELGLLSARIAVAKPRQQSLLERRKALIDRVSWLKATMSRAPQVEAQLAAIEREKQNLQRNLDEMRGKLATARVGERLEQDESATQIQVVEKPELPRYPIAPGRQRLMFMVMGIAGALGLGGIYVADTLRRTIRGTFDLKDALAGETLVVIPYWSPADHANYAGLRSIASLFRRQHVATPS